MTYQSHPLGIAVRTAVQSGWSCTTPTSQYGEHRFTCSHGPHKIEATYLDNGYYTIELIMPSQVAGWDGKAAFRNNLAALVGNDNPILSQFQ
jgi:hypothetical protein